MIRYGLGGRYMKKTNNFQITQQRCILTTDPLLMAILLLYLVVPAFWVVMLSTDLVYTFILLKNRTILMLSIAQQGTQVVVAYRDPDEARHLKVTGDLGQIVPLEFDLRNKEQLRECVRHSDIVYNLIGRDYETKQVEEKVGQGVRRVLTAL